jgi:hypothetical protein
MQHFRSDWLAGMLLGLCSWAALDGSRLACELLLGSCDPGHCFRVQGARAFGNAGDLDVSVDYGMSVDAASLCIDGPLCPCGNALSRSRRTALDLPATSDLHLALGNVLNDIFRQVFASMLHSLGCWASLYRLVGASELLLLLCDLRNR